DLIRQFLDEVIPQLNEGDSVDDAYYQYESEAKETEIQNFSDNQAYPMDLLEQLVSEYEFSGQLDSQSVEMGVKGGLLTRHKKINEVKSFVHKLVQKYSTIE
ncbi:MAG TPA: hypothetical protein VK107_06400, partial [Alloiococcus sp.]|nr:hypothetical protein [Alloiococcus sp.]